MELEGKIEEAISTIENLKSRIFDDYNEWGGETQNTMNNAINRLKEYLLIVKEKEEK